MDKWFSLSDLKCLEISHLLSSMMGNVFEVFVLVCTHCLQCLIYSAQASVCALHKWPLTSSRTAFFTEEYGFTHFTFCPWWLIIMPYVVMTNSVIAWTDVNPCAHYTGNQNVEDLKEQIPPKTFGKSNDVPGAVGKFLKSLTFCEVLYSL